MNEKKLTEEVSTIIGGRKFMLNKKEYNKTLKDIRIRIGTLLKTDNVSFLLGAGASIEAGGFSLMKIPKSLEFSLILKAESAESGEPTWLKLFYDTVNILIKKNYSIAKRKEEIKDSANNYLEIPINLESYLSHLYMWLSSIDGVANNIKICLDTNGDISIDKDNIQELIKKLKYSYSCLLDLPLKDKMDALNIHQRFIKKILTRPLNLRRANIFTLNNDTLIEQAADAEGVLLLDGFVGTIRRVFRPESYDIDFYFPAQTTEGKVHRFDRVLHLYKLHGSVTWHRCEQNWGNPYGLYASLHYQQCSEDDVMIYPSPLKYGQVLGLPYSELFRRFGNAIVQPQSVLFTIGYGFGDEHVIALIRQALAIPSFTLVIVDPDPQNEFFKKIKELEDERVWLITGLEIGKFSKFVQELLPDLREEEINTKVTDTYKKLTPIDLDGLHSEEGTNVE